MNMVILWKSSLQRWIWGLYSQAKTMALSCLPASKNRNIDEQLKRRYWLFLDVSKAT